MGIYIKPHKPTNGPMYNFQECSCLQQTFTPKTKTVIIIIIIIISTMLK